MPDVERPKHSTLAGLSASSVLVQVTLSRNVVAHVRTTAINQGWLCAAAPTNKTKAHPKTIASRVENKSHEDKMLQKGIMIDIETLGTRPGCVVLSIGACEFSSDGIGEEFYTAIDPESCTDWGLTIEPRTALWWMDQSQDARDFITKSKKIALDLALNDFAKAFKWKGKQIWCNGASFDFPILTAALHAVGKREPWEYWATNDYRTIKNLVGVNVYEACKVDATVKHNALADAVAQAQTLINMSKYLTVEKGVKRAS